MNLFQKRLILGLLTTLFIIGCAKKESEEASESYIVDDTEVTMESAMTMVSGTMDEQSESSQSLAIGESVVRTYDITYTGPRGNLIHHSSDTQTDYTGNSYGGGGELTKTSSGFELEILGRHTEVTFRNQSFASLSVRTLSPLVINQLSRSGRTWSSGQIEVNHNRAQFSSLIEPQNLQWSSSCCHPVSGSLSMTYSGSKTGSAIVTFNGCGSGEINKNGQIKNFSISYCE